MVIIRSIFKVCFVIIGTIIGAGFASGKEIYSFFCIYGINGFWGILLANGIIGLVIYVTFNIIKNNHITSYLDFTYQLVGSNKVLNYTINNIMNIFLLISFVVMVSGFGAYFMQEFNIPAIFGAILISIFAFFTFFKSIDGIIKINSCLIPILIFLIILLGIKDKIFTFNFVYLNSSSAFSWVLRSVLYASYNSIVLIPIIINLQNLISNKKQIRYIVFFTLLFMVILSTVIYFILQLNIVEIKNVEIPIVYIANKFGVIYKYLYGLVILFAIFTTAISEGYSFLNNISNSKKQYFVYSCLICILAISFSNIGFSNLLDTLYPILGYLGLVQIIILCFHSRKSY